MVLFNSHGASYLGAQSNSRPLNHRSQTFKTSLIANEYHRVQWPIERRKSARWPNALP
jgi:hypothetical protein